MLPVINSQWDRLFWLSLWGELNYIEHFFSAWIIFYKKTENQEKIKRNSLGTVLQWVLITTVCRNPKTLEYSRKFCWMSCSAQKMLRKWKHLCVCSLKFGYKICLLQLADEFTCEFRNLSSHNCSLWIVYVAIQALITESRAVALLKSANTLLKNCTTIP